MERIDRQRSVAEDTVWKLLEEVKDPEIPVLSVIDMSIVRSVQVSDRTVEVQITPTFVGCPALGSIQQEIRQRLLASGFETVSVHVSFDVPWSTDMLSQKARDRLQTMGIAPPPLLARPDGSEENQACPYCSSHNVTMESSFGPTLCKQLFYCNACRQSFERMKSL